MAWAMVGRLLGGCVGDMADRARIDSMVVTGCLDPFEPKEQGGLCQDPEEEGGEVGASWIFMLLNLSSIGCVNFLLGLTMRGRVFLLTSGGPSELRGGTTLMPGSDS